jgi:apolipoprotein D and lipocalin family protein
MGLMALACLLTPAKASTPPLKPVPSVDPVAYAGTWYEVAVIPYFFENRCQSDALTRYTILQESPLVFEDYFQCTGKNGKTIRLTGRAKALTSDNYARLNATFLNFFGWRHGKKPNYWIIGQAEDYRYAVVGHPSRRYGWILSRAPQMASSDWSAVQGILTRNGYDPCRFMAVPQKGGIQKRQSLCEWTRSDAAVAL